MPILTITVENADQLLNASALGAGALGRVERSATGGGAGFSEIGTFALVSGTRLYTYYDTAGADGSFYRVRYSTSGGGSLSAYGDEWQAGDEQAGLLCSTRDVWQRMNGNATMPANEEELILEIIREVSDELEDYVGRWLAPRPTYSSTTATLVLDVEEWTRSLLVTQGHRVCGIRSVTALGAASSSQPQTGGTYTSATLADILLRPLPTADGPAHRLIVTNYPTGSVSGFFPGYNTVTVTGTFGPASVAPRIQAVAIAAVTKRYVGKETASPLVAVGPDGGVRIMSDISPGMRDTLTRMRWPTAA